MVKVELHDEDSVKAIRDFVRSNPDIEVFDYIRRGCNGEVYFGKRIKMNDDVVLKFYWSHPNYDETEEAVILRKIEHENILKIHDLRFLPPHYAYFLTPRISGGDLQGIIDRRKLSTKESLEIISGILLGLTELHSKHKLVHRDLKPGNILLDLEKNQPIIADLGAVKKIDNSSGYVTASKSTYLYLPPESILANEYYFQSDIYQVGLIMFQLLGGYFPINSPMDWLTIREINKLEAIRNSNDKYQEFNEIIGKKVIKGKIADTKRLPFYLDGSFKRVLNKALNFHYEKRYVNPSLFLKEVYNLLRSYPDYIEEPDRLLVKHENGKDFQIYRNKKDEVVLEKRNSKKYWRKDNSHKGTLESALKIARTSK
jgi:eukaryotic-like serine/threonine-protein kinase